MSIPERRVRTLFDEAAIAKRNTELAREILSANPENLLVVAVLKGSFMFAADLLRALHRVGLSPQVEFVHLSSYRTGTVSTAVLLEKPGKRAVTIDADFVGFTCPDVFVVGYGMDAAHAFRQLPFVGVVDFDSGDPDLFDEA